MNLSPVEARVLGSLLEKEVTVPATYPLTMNALLSACNQSSGRHPQMEVSSAEADAALTSLKAHRLVRLVHASHGARTVKYRHVADETLRLNPAERTLLTVLLLRGPQTPGELRSRTERLHRFERMDDLDEVLERLAARPDALVRVLDRRPGQESRWTELLSEPAPPTAAQPPSTAVPPEVAPVAPLVGSWQGSGSGHYPTIDGFAYVEEIDFRPVAGKPVLAYRSSTRSADGARSLHGESGWLRLVGGAEVELVIAQAPGLVEVSEGVFDHDDGGLSLALASTLVAGTSTAKEVGATERHYSVVGDILAYDLAMAAVGEPLTPHLQARLTRVEPSGP